MTVITRFAPSPTGYLHLGHALSALTGWQAARDAVGHFLLRIEDIDPERCRSEYEAAIYEDLIWLGIEWEEPVRRQSEHLGFYEAVLERLKADGFVYPCFCSRKDVAEAIMTTGFRRRGPDGMQYPGTCRHIPPDEAAQRLQAGEAASWRLDAEKAYGATGTLTWHDRDAGMVAVDPGQFGDVVVARRDVPTSYNLSVVIDDHVQGITLVTRGMDLFDTTGVHRLLQALLGYPAPEYLHHRLIQDPATGAKLSKRDGAMGLRELRASGVTADEIRRRLVVEI